MRKINIALLFVLLALFNCKKVDNQPIGPECVQNKTKTLKGEVMVKKVTDGKKYYWKVETQGSLAIADDEFTYIIDEDCKTVCTQCYCTKIECSVDISSLKEVK